MVGLGFGKQGGSKTKGGIPLFFFAPPLAGGGEKKSGVRKERGGHAPRAPPLSTLLHIMPIQHRVIVTRAVIMRNRGFRQRVVHSVHCERTMYKFKSRTEGLHFSLNTTNLVYVTFVKQKDMIVYRPIWFDKVLVNNFFPLKRLNVFYSICTLFLIRFKYKISTNANQHSSQGGISCVHEYTSFPLWGKGKERAIPPVPKRGKGGG